MKQNDAALDGLAGMMAMADAAQSGAVLDLPWATRTLTPMRAWCAPPW